MSARPFVCPDCGASFARAQGLGAHRARKHGFRNPRKRSSFDTTRPVFSPPVVTEPDPVPLTLAEEAQNVERLRQEFYSAALALQARLARMTRD